ILNSIAKILEAKKQMAQSILSASIDSPVDVKNLCEQLEKTFTDLKDLKKFAKKLTNSDLENINDLKAKIETAITKILTQWFNKISDHKNLGNTPTTNAYENYQAYHESLLSIQSH